jgi:hypothetical protein
MQFSNHSIARRLRAAASGVVLAAVLVLPGVASATPATTGTITGTVTCGPSEETPAAHVLVDVAGTGLSARTDGGGRFTLGAVPAAQLLTVDASVDPQASSVSSRYNVLVQAGEMLDIGNLDLPACPQPAVEVAPDGDASPLWDGGD